MKMIVFLVSYIIFFCQTQCYQKTFFISKNSTVNYTTKFNEKLLLRVDSKNIVKFNLYKSRKCGSRICSFTIKFFFIKINEKDCLFIILRIFYYILCIHFYILCIYFYIFHILHTYN